MKKLLIFATVASMVTMSCSVDQTIKTPEQTGNAIDFRTLTEKSTRAAVVDAGTMTSFTVTGWWDQTAENAYGDLTKGAYLFNAQDITRGESTAPTMWDYNPKRYWPAVGTVDFFAYSPASTIYMTKGLDDFSEATSKISYSVLNVTELYPQEDFLVAKMLDKSSGRVTLNFHHALSRVKFQAMKNVEEIEYEIGGISLENLYSQASLDMAAVELPEIDGFDYTTGTPVVLWEDHADVYDYDLDLGDSPISVKYDVFTSVSGATTALMVIPQETVAGEIYTKADVEAGDAIFADLLTPKTNFENAFYIKVSYKAFQGDLYYAGSATEYKEMYIPVKVGDDPLTFEASRQYTFNITFGSTGGTGGGDLGDVIEFGVFVEGWDEVPPPADAN